MSRHADSGIVQSLLCRHLLCGGTSWSDRKGTVQRVRELRVGYVMVLQHK